MASHSSDRSAEATEAIAVCLVASALYPTALELVSRINQREFDAFFNRALHFGGAVGRRLGALLETIESAAGSGSKVRIVELELQIVELREELAASQLQRRALQQEADSQAETLASERDTHRSEQRSLNSELSAAKDELFRVQAKSSSLAAALAEPETRSNGAPVESHDPAGQFTITGVIEMAREHCDRVVIHDDAPREIDKLESDQKSGDWARELWKGLRALNAYAEESGIFNGGFWEWCEYSNNPLTWNAAPQKLAMSESDTVKNNSKLWRTRRFSISKDVEPDGFKHMEAHLKIAEGGGQHIPRVYFHDDAKGRTGQIHIGFIGPHRLTPTSQT